MGSDGEGSADVSLLFIDCDGDPSHTPRNGLIESNWSRWPHQGTSGEEEYKGEEGEESFHFTGLAPLLQAQPPQEGGRGSREAGPAPLSLNDVLYGEDHRDWDLSHRPPIVFVFIKVARNC